MAKAYLIGGPPRVGKTNLALSFIQQRPILASSTDAIRYMLRRVIDKESEPNLFKLGKYTSNDPEKRQFIKNHLKDVIVQQEEESTIVWKSVVNFINSNLEDGFDVLIEGIAVVPKLVKQLDCEYSVIFLGNQDREHFEPIIKSARNNTNDWLHGLENETIEAFCMFAQAYSKHLELEAIQHKFNYLEVNDKDFTGSIQKALTQLLI